MEIFSCENAKHLSFILLWHSASVFVLFQSNFWELFFEKAKIMVNLMKDIKVRVAFDSVVTSLYVIEIVKNVKLTCPTVKFFRQSPNILTSFSPNFFGQFFSWNQNCQQLKSPKPQHFHEFSPQKNRQISREIKVEFLDKKWRFRTVWINFYLFFPLF